SYRCKHPQTPHTPLSPSTTPFRSNSAGYLLSGAVEETTIEEAKAQMETNFFGAFRVIKAVLPAMRIRKAGQIVNISSLAGVVPLDRKSTRLNSSHQIILYDVFFLK